MIALKSVSALIVTFGLSAAYANESVKEEIKHDKDAVNTACAEESKTASCDGKLVGTGLLKCIHGYKKEHKDFKIGDSCKGALGKLKEDRKERKEAKMEKQEEKKENK